MKKILILTSFSLGVVGLICAPGFRARAAAPKRLLLVTTTIGFRHAAVPLDEQILRQMAKQTGEFTIVSTTDSPDFPAKLYQQQVDQRNARILADKALPNDLQPIDGNFGGPGATTAQWSAVSAMNDSLAPLVATESSSSVALNRAILSGHQDSIDIRSKVNAETQSVLAVANARSDAFQKMQSSSAKLDARQVHALAQVADRPAGGPGRGGSSADAQPLTPSQQAAVDAMNSSLSNLAQAASTARAALAAGPYSDGVSPTDLKLKADAFEAAELKLSNAKADAFAKIQNSPDRLSPTQVDVLARPVNRGFPFGPGRGGPDPVLPDVTKVLQQYLGREKLRDYDAVAFCSTTGELPIPDKDAFFKWIADGHGFIGLHSATDTLHQTPEYINMIGAEFAGHGMFHPKVEVDNVDPKSPINAGWGKSIPINEEFYLFKNFDPSQVHLLLAMHEQPYTKQPGIYPVSWIKMYGKGRVYYTSLGHRDDVLLPDATIGDQEYKVRFNQAPVALAVQKQILNGVRWALGILDADAMPQAH